MRIIHQRWRNGNPLHIEKGGAMLHNIKEKAKERGITLTDLEKQAGISPKGIYKWDRQDPSVYKVYTVAKILDTTVEELLEG